MHFLTKIVIENLLYVKIIGKKLSKKTSCLKEVCHEIFDLHLLWFNPFWARDKQAKVFSNSVSMSRDIRLQSDLRDVQHTAKI